MTLYMCKECRNWNSGVNHICGPPAPDLRDQRTLEKAVVKAARKVLNYWQTESLRYQDLSELERTFIELDGLDRPFLEE